MKESSLLVRGVIIIILYHTVIGCDVCPNNCTGNGKCIDSKCQCEKGFSGIDCSESCPNKCNGNGECIDGKCQCEEGFSGKDCSTTLCPNNCSGHGKCTNGKCKCEKGFSGKDCSEKECKKDADCKKECPHGGKCKSKKCKCEENGKCKKDDDCKKECPYGGNCKSKKCKCKDQCKDDSDCLAHCKYGGKCPKKKCECTEKPECTDKEACVSICTWGGNCTDFMCICKGGETCQTDDHCDKWCKAGGKCITVWVNKVKQKSCECKEVTDVFCKKEEDCDKHCPNGGDCVMKNKKDKVCECKDVQLSWIEADNGKFPSGAVVGGERDKQPCYICRVYVPGRKAELCIGTLIQEKKVCLVSHYGNAENSTNYEVFTDVFKNHDFSWHSFHARKKLPLNAILGGFSAFGKTDYMYVGRVKSPDGHCVIGKFWPNGPQFYAVINGKEKSYHRFELLVNGTKLVDKRNRKFL